MERSESAPPHVPLRVCEREPRQHARALLLHLRPHWQTHLVQFKLLTDGITNKLIKCSYGEEVVLVRIYGNKTDLLIDRTAETRNIILLHKENLAPELFATFENGLAYEFAPGVTLTSDTVSQPQVFRLVAAQMARLHQVAVAKVRPVLWDKLHQFYELVPDCFSQAHIHKQFLSMNIPKQVLLSEIECMKRELSKESSPLVFCHNDLLLGNIVYNEGEHKVTFIDYEYAAVNYQAYDIANHLNEWAGVEQVDYGHYPSKVVQLAWLRHYLQLYSGGGDVSERQLQHMYVLVNKFSLVSHLLWGLWALVQAQHSTIQFDFLKFADARFKRYFDTKQEFLALDADQENHCRSRDCQL